MNMRYTNTQISVSLYASVQPPTHLSPSFLLSPSIHPLFLYLSLHPPTHLSPIHSSIPPSLSSNHPSPSIHLPIFLSTHPSLSLHPYNHPSISIHPSLHQPTHSSFSSSIHLSPHPYNHPPTHLHPSTHQFLSPSSTPPSFSPSIHSSLLLFLHPSLPPSFSPSISLHLPSIPLSPLMHPSLSLLLFILPSLSIHPSIEFDQMIQISGWLSW